MAHAKLECTKDWSEAARFTAPAEGVDIALGNPSEVKLFWTTTSDDNAPVDDPETANPIKSGDNLPMTLFPNERLWVAGKSARASVTF